MEIPQNSFDEHEQASHKRITDTAELAELEAELIKSKIASTSKPIKQLTLLTR